MEGNNMSVEHIHPAPAKIQNPSKEGFFWRPRQGKIGLGMRDILGARLPAHYLPTPEKNKDIWTESELKMTSIMEHVCDTDREFLNQLRRVKRLYLVSRVDDSGTLVRCGSKVVSHSLGFSPEQTLGRSFFEIFSAPTSGDAASGSASPSSSSSGSTGQSAEESSSSRGVATERLLESYRKRDGTAIAQIKTWLKKHTEHHTFLTLFDGSRPTSSLSVSVIVLRDREEDPIYNLFVLKKTCLQVLPDPLKRSLPIATVARPPAPTGDGVPKPKITLAVAKTEDDGQEPLFPKKKKKGVKRKSESDPGQEKLLREAAAAAAASCKSHPIVLSEEKKKMLRTVMKHDADPFSALTSKSTDKTLFAGWPQDWHAMLKHDRPAYKKETSSRSRATKRVRTMERMDEMMTSNPDDLACPRKYKRVAFLMTSSNDPEFPTVAATKSFEKMHGYSTKESCGKNLRFLQGPKTSDFSVKKLTEGLNSKSEARSVMVNYRKDGSMYMNEMRLLPMQIKKGKTQFLGFVAELDKDYQTLQNAETLLSLGSESGH